MFTDNFIYFVHLYYVNIFITGRASASPPMDIFITLLSLGVNGYKNLIGQRKEMYKYLKEELGKVAAKHGEKILETKNNPISIGKYENRMKIYQFVVKSLYVFTYERKSVLQRLLCIIIFI